jgi:hypothetical protein
VKRGLVRPDGRHVAIGSGFALVGLPTMLALPTDDVTRTCWAFLVGEATARLGFLLVEWRVDVATS